MVLADGCFEVWLRAGNLSACFELLGVVLLRFPE